jgi:hypothetical protein
MPRIVVVLLGFILLMSCGIADAGQATTYTPAPWKDCSKSKCSAGEVTTYLLWSRVSDSNDCKQALSAPLGASGANTYCNNLIHGSAPAPVDELGVVNGLKQFFAAQTASFPLASSSAGLIPEADKLTPLEQSFGSMFVERPLVVPLGKGSVTLGYQHTHWASVDGNSLSDIHTEENGNSTPRDLTRCAVDITACPSLRWTTDLDFSTDSLLIGGAWGLPHHVEVSGILPVTWVHVSGRSFLRNAFMPSQPQGVVLRESTASGRSVGLGDGAVRGKWALPWGSAAEARPKFRFAVAGELRFPSGDPDEFTGLGHWQEAIMFIGQFRAKGNPTDFVDAIARGVGVHFNIGYTWAGSGIQITNIGPGNTNQYAADFTISPSDSWNYTVGGDLPLLRGRGSRGAVTVSADLIGTTFLDSAVFTEKDFTGANQRFERQPFLDAVPHVTRLLWTVGGKVQLAQNILATTQFIGSANDSGLQPGLSFVVGIEYALRRTKQ